MIGAVTADYDPHSTPADRSRRPRRRRTLKTADPAATATERRRPPIDPHVIDLVLALAFTSTALVLYLTSDTRSGYREPDTLGIVLVLLTTLPLAGMHFYALGQYAVMLGATLTLSGLHYQSPIAVTAALLVALFIIALTSPYWQAIVAGVATGVLSLVSVFAFGYTNVSIAQVVVLWLVFSATFLLGLIIRLYRESAARAARRAALFAQDRELRAIEAVAQERARLARELHDGVGHALNVVLLHSQGAQRVMDARPAMAREALGSIETAARQALRDVERMLGVLRSEQDDALAAQPGIGQLAALAERVTEAGLPVTVLTEGAAVSLPSSVDLTAFRIVQEALTNSLKHAGNARATVWVRYAATGLELEVVDTGRGAAAPAPGAEGGRGIPGMRERIAVFGGRLEVGPLPAGGFRVWAWLPLEGGAA